MSLPTPLPEKLDRSVRAKRPFLLTLILAVLTFWFVLGWLRFTQTLIQQQVILETLPAWVFWYLLLAGLIWGVAVLPALWGVFTRKPWAQAVLIAAAVFYPASYWVERLFLWQDPSGQRNWPFMLLLTLLWLGLMVAGFYSERVRDYFSYRKREREDR
jgi:hypothetical protein